MIDLLIVVALNSLSVYAIIKWWFDTSLMDHVTQVITLNRVTTFAELKQIIEADVPQIGGLIVELFECPWCLSFHVSFWIHIFVMVGLDFYTPLTFILSVIASAGVGMKLYSNDLK